MTDQEQESDTTGGVDRRTLLKGTAAAGMAGSALPGSASAHENEVMFRSVTDERFEFRITVSGEIHRGDWTDPNDAIVDKNTAKGWCSGGGGDDFVFSGEIEDLDVNGPGKVIVNGDVILDTTEKEKKEKKKKLPNTITINGQGPTVKYKFRVGGTVRKGDKANSADRVIDGNVVRGVVGGGVDNFHYSGSLVFDSADGPLRVCLDLNDP